MKLFISAERKAGILNDYCAEKNISLVAESLITFEAVPGKVTQPFEVIFISSKRSFDYLNSLNVSLREDQVFATIGKATTKYLNEKNSQTEFTGVQSGDPEIVALEFKKWLGDRRVLFPVSDISHLSIADKIPDEQKEVVICYRTIPFPKKIEDCNIYVFTSPGNLKSFLTLNSIPENALIIAWGKTTEKTMKSLGIEASFTLGTASDEELVEILSSSLREE